MANNTVKATIVSQEVHIQSIDQSSSEIELNFTSDELLEQFRKDGYNGTAKPTMQYNEERKDLGAISPIGTPLVIYVEPSSFCNLSCTFCPQHISPDAIHKKNMSFDLFKKMIDDLKSFPEKPKLMRFCGLGDSLFNKKFLEMVKYAREQNVVEKLELITNGLLLNDKLIAELPLYLHRIIVSLNGLSSEDYVQFTNKKINFEEFVEKLSRLHKVESDCITHIKIHSASLKDESKKQFFYNTFGSICDEIYIENLVDLWPQMSSNLGVESGQRFDSGELNKVKVCPQIFKSMQVNSDGRVIPCCIDWAVVNVIGDITKEGVKDVWDGNTLKKLRNVHLQGKRFEIDPCKGCSMNEYSDKDNIDDMADVIYKKVNSTVIE
jgi:radical SAM protein with 4Fe4S-binding SPASM domain